MSKINALIIVILLVFVVATPFIVQYAILN